MTEAMQKNSYEVSIDGAKKFVADFADEHGFTCFPYFDSDAYIASLDPRVFEVIVSAAIESGFDYLNRFDPYYIDTLLFMNLRSTEDRMRKGIIPDINKNHVLVGWIM